MTAYRIPVSQGAFRVKRPRIEKPDYLAWIRQLPCVVTGRTDGIEAAHIRYSYPRRGKRAVGKGEKPDDRWAVPLHHEQHRLQHSMNEEAYWNSVGIDPVMMALCLYGAYPDFELAEMVVNNTGRYEHDTHCSQEDVGNSE